jgi:quinol monooxygenase YgiN
MSTLKVVAHIRAKAGHENDVKKGLKNLVAPTLKEEGCLQYDLHQDIKDPSLFIFVEEWESAAHLKKHGESEHIAAFGTAVKDIVESRKLYLLNKI